MPHHRRRSRLRRFLSITGKVSATALLLFAGSRAAPVLLSSRPIASWPLQPFPLTYFPPPPPELLQSWERSSFPRKLFPVRPQSPPPPQLPHDDAVLLPDDEVLVLAAEPAVGDAMCVFHGGVSSQARALGRLPGPGRHAYLCPVPSSVQHPTLQAPSLQIPSSAAAPPLPAPAAPAPAQLAPADLLLNWNDTSLVFDSALLEGGGGLLVFAKGHRRQGVNAPPSEIHCLYSGATADGSIVAVA